MQHVLINPDLHKRILNYYLEAGLDYAFWSKNFNMHFGIGNLTSLFNRERMLNRMSEEVIQRLGLDESSVSVVDLGCGVGATMRKAIQMHQQINVTGLTLVQWQKEKADELHANHPGRNRLKVLVEDYHNTSIGSDSTDAAYAIESACYSPCSMHQVFFDEVHRILRNEGRLVIADGFLKSPEVSLNSCVGRIYKGICENWALPGMMNVEAVRNCLKIAGFRDVKFEEISWKVAPSVLHVPIVIVMFLIYKKIRRERLSRQSINNLKGSFQTLLLGLHRRNFGYFLVTAKK